MRIEINGMACEMPPKVQQKLLDYLQNDLEQRYARDMDGAMKALSKAFTRKLLLDMERKARKAGGDELAARFRPPRRADPNLFLANVIRDIGEEGLKHVCLYITLDESGENYIVSDLSAGRINGPAGSVSLESQVGRSLAGPRDDGEWENDVLEAAGDPVESAVSEGALLRLR